MVPDWGFKGLHRSGLGSNVHFSDLPISSSSSSVLSCCTTLLNPPRAVRTPNSCRWFWTKLTCCGVFSVDTFIIDFIALLYLTEGVLQAVFVLGQPVPFTPTSTFFDCSMACLLWSFFLLNSLIPLHACFCLLLCVWWSLFFPLFPSSLNSLSLPGRSALHWACSVNHLSLARTLIRYGAAVDMQDHKVR